MKNSTIMKTHIALGSAVVLIICIASGEKIDLPIPCRNTSDCTSVSTLPNDAVCIDGYCMCQNVDKIIKNCSGIDASMHEKRTPGLIFRTCKHNQDCNFQGGFCNTTINQCDCLKGYVPSSNKLYCFEKAQSMDFPCKDINQCLAFLANTVCHRNKCACVSGYHYIDNACWKIVDFGEPCTKDQECLHIGGAVCSMDKKICGCPPETVLNEDGKRCLHVAREMREDCTESVQCTTTFKHSSCIDKICQCQNGYHYEHDVTRCFPNKDYDEDCANNYECYQAEDYNKNPPVKSLVCESNKCVYIKDYTSKDNICVNAGSSFAACLPVIIFLIANRIFLEIIIERE